jgi:CMP-2-keto-3-deoxyoctulosonic acid synthetase
VSTNFSGPFSVYGIYVYDKEALKKFKVFSSSALEQNEQLEFMRFIDFGIKIRTHHWSSFVCDEVNVPEDIEILERDRND